MGSIEARVKAGLRQRGIPCHTVFSLPDPDNPRLVIALSATKSERITPSRIERVLNSLGIAEFRAQDRFHRLSSAFLHLEVHFDYEQGRRTRIDAQ